MSAHTPGEWIAEPDPYSCDGDWRIGVGDRVQCVATCSRRDARLLTAAPDLLAALQDVIGWVSGREHWHTDEPEKSVDRARAAIAKATTP